MGKEKRAYAAVEPVARRIAGKLQTVCKRVIVAGSIRRGCALVGDIEIVAIPRFRQRSMFGVASERSMVDDFLDEWQARVGFGHFRMGPNGAKMKRFWVTSIGGEAYQVDLFLQPDPATWGVNLMIRTGSARYSQLMVTPKSKGGYMPDDYQVNGARVWDRNHQALETPEEEDVFRLWGMDWVDPRERDLK